MTEEQILADGYWVKFYFMPQLAGGTRLFSGVYCGPKDAELRRAKLDGSEFKVCIETQVINGQTKYWGKVGALRIAINNQAQYETFLSMALDSIN